MEGTGTSAEDFFLLLACKIYGYFSSVKIAAVKFVYGGLRKVSRNINKGIVIQNLDAPNLSHIYTQGLGKEPRKVLWENTPVASDGYENRPEGLVPANCVSERLLYQISA